MMVRGFGDAAFRVFNPQIGGPIRMLELLDKSFLSKWKAMRISVLTAMLLQRFISSNDKPKHIEKFDILFLQLKMMAEDTRNHETQRLQYCWPVWGIYILSKVLCQLSKILTLIKCRESVYQQIYTEMVTKSNIITITIARAMEMAIKLLNITLQAGRTSEQKRTVVLREWFEIFVDKNCILIQNVLEPWVSEL